MSPGTEALCKYANPSDTSKTEDRSNEVLVISAPPTSCRTWRPLKPPNNNIEDDVADMELDRQSLFAEVRHTNSYPREWSRGMREGTQKLEVHVCIR